MIEVVGNHRVCNYTKVYRASKYIKTLCGELSKGFLVVEKYCKEEPEKLMFLT